MHEVLIRFLESHGIQGAWLVLLGGALPGIEARYAVPLGLYAGLPLWQAALLAVPTSVLVVVPVLLWFDPLAQRCERLRVIGPFLQWLLRKARRHQNVVDRWGMLGLTIFVGIPVPGFGVWTGALIAVVVGMSFWRSTACMALGVTLSCVITTALYRAGSLVLQ